MVADLHEHTEATDLPHHEQARLQRDAGQTRVIVDLVRSGDAMAGRQPVFADAAIQACLTLKVLFGLPSRQAAGLVARLLELAGLDWPDMSQVKGRPL